MKLEKDIEAMFDAELSLHLRAWEHYSRLPGVLKRRLTAGEADLEIHFNPGRVRSVMANVDAASLSSRKCFLCPDGLGPEQLTTSWRSEKGNDYWLRVNPFPIFNKHFTLSAAFHTRQSFEGRCGDMLEFCSQLPSYVLFYNGPSCGASAPDHFHFQAFPKGHLPVEKIVAEKDFKILKETPDAVVGEIDRYMRGAYAIVAKSPEAAEDWFDFIISQAPGHCSEEWEPRLNLMAWSTSSGGCIMLIFFRRESRSHTFEADENGRRLLISPGSVEMAGIMLTSDRNTFETISNLEIAGILSEVSLDSFQAERINNSIYERSAGN